MSETSIGTKVRSEREALGRSREQLAFRIGVSTSTVTRLENQDRVPSVATLKRIADELGMTIDALLTPQSTPSSATPRPDEGVSSVPAMNTTDVQEQS